MVILPIYHFPPNRVQLSVKVVIDGGKHLCAVHEQLTSDLRDTSVAYVAGQNPDFADIIGMWNTEMEKHDLSNMTVNVIITDFDTSTQSSSFHLRQREI